MPDSVAKSSVGRKTDDPTKSAVRAMDKAKIYNDDPLQIKYYTQYR